MRLANLGINGEFHQAQAVIDGFFVIHALEQLTEPLRSFGGIFGDPVPRRRFPACILRNEVERPHERQGNMAARKIVDRNGFPRRHANGSGVGHDLVRREDHDIGAIADHVVEHSDEVSAGLIEPHGER